MSEWGTENRFVRSWRSKLLATAALGLVTLTCPGQTLTNFAQLGRNKIGSSQYNRGPDPDDSYTFFGGGNDIGDNIDEFTYSYTEVCGDFDIKVRASVAANAPSSKAGIMVRETLAEDSRMIFERVTPPAVAACMGGIGANSVRFAYRTGKHISDANGDGVRFNDEINDGRHEEGTGSPAYPDTWLRLVRQGAVFTGYSSTNGVNWTLQGSQDTSLWERGRMNPKLLVGLGVSRDRGGAGCETAIAGFSNFRITGDPKFCLCLAELGCSNSIVLTFTHPVGTGATDAHNYVLSGSNSPFINGARAGRARNTVILDTDPLIEGAVYTATVTGNVRDSNGALIDPGCNAVSFTHADGYQAAKVHVLYNQAPNGWTPDYASGLAGYYFQTLSYQRGIPTAVTGQPAHIQNPAYFEDGPTAISDTEDHECYVSRIIGLLQINVDGDYKFACSSDDSSALFLSTDENPANKVLIAREPNWTGLREWNGSGEGGRGPNGCWGFENQSCAIHLLAGRKYYIELVAAEGGGGNHAAVTWDAGTGTFPANGTTGLATDPGDPIWGGGKGELVPIRWRDNHIFNNLGPVTIIQEPQDKKVPFGGIATFTVTLDGAAPYAIQWRANGVAVPGATDTTFTMIGFAANNGTRVSASIADACGTTNTREAILTVVANPVLLSCSSRGNCDAVCLAYNRPMQLDGTYTLLCSNNITGSVTSSTLSNPRFGTNRFQVCLTVTPELLPGTNTYYVTVAGAHGQDGSIIDPNRQTCSFIHGADYPAFNVLYRRYDGVGGGNLQNFLASAKYRNDQADVVLLNPTGFFEAPKNVADYYGAKILGYYVAPREGDYRFWMSSDDQGALYLATDAIPAHKQQIAAEPGWAGSRAWADAGHDNNDGRGNPPIYDPTGSGNLKGNGSLPFHLLAGQKVYLEGVFTEGTNGDNFAATVTIDDPTVPTNGTPPILQSQFARLRVAPDGTVFSTLCGVVCNVTPTNLTVSVGQSATFTGTFDGPPPYRMLWKRNGSPIPGETNSVYTTPPAVLADDGTIYTFALANEFGTNECSAVLHVRHNPIMVSCTTGLDQIHVVFNKPVRLDGTYDLFDATLAYTVTISSIVYGSNHSEVVLTTGTLPADHAFVLTITGVRDEENPANLMEPDPTFCRFGQYPGRFCTDFSNGLPPGSDTSGSTMPPYVQSNYLVLTLNGVTSHQNYWRIPLPGARHFNCFSARWKTLLNGPFGNSCNGFSFSAGQDIRFPVAAEEGGDNGLSVTVDTRDHGGAEVGIEVRWNGVQLAFTRIAGGGNAGPELLRNKFVDATVDVSVTGLATFNYDTFTVSAQIPNYTGLDINQYVFAARTGGFGAEDCWIDDVCIYDYPLGRIAITVSPQNVTLPECSIVTFTAATIGSPCYYYQWFSNSVAIAGAVNASYTTPPLLRGANGAIFSVVASNDFSNTSRSGTVHIITDNTPPQLISATRGCLDHAKVIVVFNDALDPASANDAVSYSISDGVTVNSAVLQADGRTVILSTAPLADGGSYDLMAPGIKDCALNALAAGSRVRIRVLGAHIGSQNVIAIEAEDYDALFSNFGSPRWIVDNLVPGYSGTGYLEAVPNTGVNVGNIPPFYWLVWADYCVNFPVAGRYYIWARGSAAPGDADNSFHASIDGAQPVPAAIAIGNTVDGWGVACGNPKAFGWVNVAQPTTAASYVDVTAPGQHTFRVWMREDGLKLDQFVLTTDAAFTLSACDPAMTSTGRESDGGQFLAIIRRSDGLDILWVGGGRLECSPTLGPGASWTTVSTTSPYHVASPSGTRFYRVVNP
jgi:hypothetical protein